MDEQSIFLAALEREDPAERTAFLDEACAGTPELRQRVEKLLSVHERAGSFMQGPAVPVAATADMAIISSSDSAGSHRLDR